MMKIALARPNYDSHIITPPLGLGYLSAYLRKSGIEVVIFDGLRDNVDNRELLQRILQAKPDAVGLTCLTAFYTEVMELSRGLKDAGQTVIIGGVHPTFLPRETLADSNCDHIVAGEGEIALLQLARQNFDNTGIAGVYSAHDMITADTPVIKADKIQDLDELPFPDWEQLDPREYPQAPHGAIVKHFPVAPVMTTRGCPYGCTFCASPQFYDRKIRFRTPKNVVDELEYLVREFGVREIHFEDDNLTMAF